jgi:hypothetical protein
MADRHIMRGAGMGWRSELATPLLLNRTSVDFVEVVAEACFSSARAQREAAAAREVWPVIPHGVKLSLGSAEGIDDDRVRRLGALARTLRAPMVTEHIALTSAGGREIGHLTQLPRTRDAVRVVARNVACARRALPDVPFALENVAWTLQWPDDTLREEDFYTEVLEATGCPMLLDLGNLYANALNERRDPLQVLRALPLERVAMVHIAGGHLEDNFFFDDHASPVGTGVFELLAVLIDAVGAVPVLLERDANFPPFEALLDELERVRALQADRRFTDPAQTCAVADDAPVSSRYTDAQRTLATALTASVAPPCHTLGAPLQSLGDDALARARRVLQRKRVDDALPLLPRLASHAARTAALAAEVIATTPRPLRGTAIADAWWIAHAATRDATLAAAAAVDELTLRARFYPPEHPGDALRPRRAPYLGSTTARGRRVWALKAPGTEATVRLVERHTPHGERSHGSTAR